MSTQGRMRSAQTKSGQNPWKRTLSPTKRASGPVAGMNQPDEGASMRDIKRLVISKRSRFRVLHVETPNGIVNIRCGLSDAEGRTVDAVEIFPDYGCRVDGFHNT